MFIVYEGIDGSGKTTLAGELEVFLNSRGIKTCTTVEPTRTNIFGKFIRFCLTRKIYLPQEFFQKLYFWDRIIHMREIKRFLANGITVICDRNFFSTIAYGYSSDVDIKIIIRWHRKAIQKGLIVVPDVIFLIDLPPEVAMERLRAKGKQLELFETEKRLQRVADGYGIAISIFFEIKVIRINGHQSVQSVLTEILEKGKF